MISQLMMCHVASCTLIMAQLAMAHIILKSFLLREVLNKQGAHLLRGDGSRSRKTQGPWRSKVFNDGHCSNYDRLSSFCDSLNQSCTI